MYPANPAALLSYLVLCLIECDVLWRQKSRLIQSNKLPWARRPMLREGAAACHSVNRSFLTLSFDGLVFQSLLSERSADLKSKDSEFFMSPASLVAFWSLSWMINRGDLKKENRKSLILFCVALFHHSKQGVKWNGDSVRFSYMCMCTFKSPSSLTPTGVLVLC